MPVIDYKYVKCLENIPTIAVIQLEIVRNDLNEHRIIVETEKIPFRSQGCIEGGHEIWNHSAEQALKVVLEKVNPINNSFDVIIRKLQGRIAIDTNNASIGVACMLAVLKFLDISPEDKALNRIHEFVKENWKQDIALIPNFESIIFIEN